MQWITARQKGPLRHLRNIGNIFQTTMSSIPAVAWLLIRRSDSILQWSVARHLIERSQHP
jgi:hypothetical protein